MYYWVYWYSLLVLIARVISTIMLVLIAVNVGRIRGKLEMTLHMLNDLVGRKHQPGVNP